MLRKFTISILVIGFFSVVGFNLMAFHDGYVGVTKRPGGDFQGCICHNEGNPSPEVSVLLVGPASVRAGDTVAYQLKITGGPDSAGGCDIATYAGRLLTSPAESFLQAKEFVYFAATQDSVRKNDLTHNAAKPSANDTITFTFRYVAPNIPNSKDTIYANGNSVNHDLSSSDDKWNFAANKVISITSTGINNNNSVVKNFTLEQNYPNPFNPATNIRFSLDKSSSISLKVYDLNGKEITALINNKNYSSGNHTITFDAAKYNLVSGLYFYKLESNGLSEVRKMMLVK
jgi:hypothetical protein